MAYLCEQHSLWIGIPTKRSVAILISAHYLESLYGLLLRRRVLLLSWMKSILVTNSRWVKPRTPRSLSYYPAVTIFGAKGGASKLERCVHRHCTIAVGCLLPHQSPCLYWLPLCCCEPSLSPIELATSPTSSSATSVDNYFFHFFYVIKSALSLLYTRRAWESRRQKKFCNKL